MTGLAKRGVASLPSWGTVDRLIFSLTHSGTITALNNSCTDTPLCSASDKITRNDSSRSANMNLAMADEPRPVSWPVWSVYNNLYTISRARGKLLAISLEKFGRSASSVYSEWLIQNRVTMEVH